MHLKQFNYLSLQHWCSYCFTQENWDYIGSSRMVYDMEHNDFPNEAQAWKV